MIYLDNNATTPVAEEVLDAMTPYYREAYGNPHSPHAAGRMAHDGVEKAREEVAALLGASRDEIFFTSCGTESNAISLLGSIRANGRSRIVTTAVEHPSVLALLRTMAGEGRIELAVVGVGRDGALDLEGMAAVVDDRTLLVSVMLAQNETGVVMRVGDVARLCRTTGALLHVDAVQAAGKIPVDVEALGCDLLSISGHKFHAPKGIGALYARRGTKLAPIWQGGNQERGLRSGTEAVPLVIGLGCASSLATAFLPQQESVRRLRDRFEQRVLSELPDAAVNGFGPRLPNTSSLGFRHLRADRLVAAFDSAGVCASAGAACRAGAISASPVLTAMGTPREYALGTVRFSLSRMTTEQEIDEAAAIIVDTVRQGGELR